MAGKRYNAILDDDPGKIFPGLVERTDFKQVLKFFRLLDDDTLSDEEKLVWMLQIFFTSPQTDAQKCVDAVAEFIAGQKIDKGEEGAEPAKKLFCYNQDAGRLFAAFWQAYGIDLRAVSMHWWAFLELFQALPEETRLMQVIELRGRKPGKKDTKEQKAELRKAQKAVALDTIDSTKALDDFFDAWGKCGRI